MTKMSVIIPTVNAVEELDLTIRSIKRNADNEIEFVVVVDPDMQDGKVNKEILAVCKKHAIKASVNQENQGPYGSWNRGADIATTAWLIFATDDQYFAPHWDRNLLKYWKPQRLVAGRLVEPGIIPVYKTNLQQDFGVTPNEFKEDEFIAWCGSRTVEGFTPDGFFIPLLQKREDFEALGRYPVRGRFGTSGAESNDYNFIQAAIKKGYQFGTAEDSYSYHFQASSWKKKTLKPTIAAVILTKNEEDEIEKCLKSLSWVDKIFVIDSGSTDKTVSIAKSYHATSIVHDFKNYADQRNFALTQVASFDWVLMVDADETVERDLAHELQSFAKDIYLDGVNIVRKNYILGKWIAHTDWYPDYRLIFFRPKMMQYKGSVHEVATPMKGNGIVGQAKGAIVHHNYDTIAEFVEKNLITYPLQYAKMLDSEKVRFSAGSLLEKPIDEFMRRFFLAEGYKDGMHGLILSLLMGAQALVAYCYLWELQGKKPELTVTETHNIFQKIIRKSNEISYWLMTMTIAKSSGATKFINQAKRKILKFTGGI